jgi:hypothetical protein
VREGTGVSHRSFCPVPLLCALRFLQQIFSSLVGPSDVQNRRDAYVFEINPLGTQSDDLIVEEQRDTNGGDFDRGWDGVWTSEARTVAPSIAS